MLTYLKSVQITAKFTPAILKINMKHGSEIPGCLYVGSGDLSVFPDDRELLFTEGTQFNILEKQMVGIENLMDALKIRTVESSNKWSSIVTKVNYNTTSNYIVSKVAESI